MDLIQKGIYWVFLLIDSVLLKFIALCYKVYLEISSLRLLTDEFYDLIVTRIYVVAGIIALFALSYALLQNIINPDGKNGDGGKQIVKRVVMAIVTVIAIPFAFDFLYGLQYAVLSDNVIGQLLGLGTFGEILEFPDEEDGDCALIYNMYEGELSTGGTGSTKEYYIYSTYGNYNCNIDQNFELCEVILVSEYEGNAGGCGDTDLYLLSDAESDVDVSIFQQQQTGNTMAYYLMEAYLYPYVAFVAAESDVTDSATLLNSSNYYWENVMLYAQVTGEYGKIINFNDNVVNGEMSYHYVISWVIAGFFCYCLFLYTIDLAVRVVRLSFYQMIAPIPAFLSILPNNSDLLNKWFKSVASIYLEVFVRVACLSGGIFIIGLITSYFSS